MNPVDGFENHNVDNEYKFIFSIYKVNIHRQN